MPLRIGFVPMVNLIGHEIVPMVCFLFYNHGNYVTWPTGVIDQWVTYRDRYTLEKKIIPMCPSTYLLCDHYGVWWLMFFKYLSS